MNTLLASQKKQMALQSALSCKGWTDQNKLLKLFDLIQETENLDGDILEIGSAWGRSTVLIGLASKKRIWSIDPHTGGLAYIQKGTNQNSFDEFLSNIKTYGIFERVTALKHSTQEVLDSNLIPKELKFSLVFIDGLHTAEGITLDFLLAFEHLEENGVMVFDDYFEPSVMDYSRMIDKLSGLVFFVRVFESSF
ncbi:MAG: class I SAM-dependent methyltransferase [Thermodesulfovibrionales bacterium]|nr:class I SAM-dependent methyltransferase [Thermodesulfovibrionales bacterium]